MKTFLWLVVATAVAGVLFPASAQVTSLTVNGVSANFTMVSGDSIRWQYNIPTPGGTVEGEIWYDVNANGTIEPGTDVNKFTFTQTDGDTNGYGGPPDIDGTANGQLVFAQRVGVAPGKYILKFTFNSLSASIAGTVSALASPAHTISGKVTPPAGKSARYINVVLHRSDQYGNNFWDAYTDVNGDYTIAMDADTAGNPWGVRIENNPYPPAIITPQDTPLVVTGNHTGYNFTLYQAAAQVDGTVKDEAGQPQLGNEVSLNRNDYLVYYQGRVGGSGGFQIGLTSGDLAAQTWHLQTRNSSNNGNTGSLLVAQRNLPVINMNDSLFYPLVLYTANSTIQGQLRINGSPANFPIQIQASSFDSALAQTTSDSTTGNFSVQVTNKIYNYTMRPIMLPPNYIFSDVTAHPGQSNVVISITVTSVKERASGVPAVFALQQNYPNPFNPVTHIDYDIPIASRVRLTVFNILGQEVARVLDADQNAGKYRATLDASRLSSGVYLYQLTATSSSAASPKVYSMTRKLVVMR